ncbi:aldo-keto reductase family 1 member E1 [Annulohypoxylon bovei var. microspora]|nr:aldo-keto reductase family 1 member E1 [Annulohypoxylon bovei var. microspora]
MSSLTRAPALSNTVKLVNGMLMPQIKLRLYPETFKATKASVYWALRAGFRGFDTAQTDRTERAAGEAINEFISNMQGITREDIFFTSKLDLNTTTYQQTRDAIRDSIKRTGLGYIDMYLLNNPFSSVDQRLATWDAIEDAIDEGEIRCGGVFGHRVGHLRDIMISQPRIQPVVNQIEAHPFNTQKDVRTVCAGHGIVVETYAPLGVARCLVNPVILNLSKKYDCLPAQLMMRWSIQHGLVPLINIIKLNRLKRSMFQSVEVDFFTISAEDMETMDWLDEGRTLIRLTHRQSTEPNWEQEPVEPTFKNVRYYQQ